MHYEVTFTKADGSRVLRYLVIAEDINLFGGLMSKLVSDVVTVIGPRPHVDVYQLKSC
jgi:hypothetical protein